ncbi:NAC transcription factor 29-like [Cannabis sativa]|uniref:NAC transcription factor 29-like n=1 Tax=Cannabis sativa TaxID=3483 RepID=UPI0029CA37AD|nr:NAC transcription factor 29-like [Cannabis sativa]
METMTSVPGVIFSPNDQELLQFYLTNKNFNPHLLPLNHIQQLHSINDFHPDELTALYPPINQNEWYFYYPNNNNNNNNKKRSNRKAKGGTWHGNATKKKIFDEQNNEIGVKRTLDFKDLNKTLTYWKMTEYQLTQSNHPQQCNWMLCKIYKMKSKELKNKIENEYKEQNTKRQKLMEPNNEQGYQKEAVTEEAVRTENEVVVEEQEPTLDEPICQNRIAAATQDIDEPKPKPKKQPPKNSRYDVVLKGFYDRPSIRSKTTRTFR